MTSRISRARPASVRHTVLASTATSFAVLALATSGAFAQEQMESVTVTGFRASLENTIVLKKESTQIVEAISAEDIGKLPDASIGEAISRLPGLATQRTNGRASDISIRGTSPDFSTTLLNGREQVSTNDNRSVQFDQYPAELMSGVVIYKTPSADLVGAGLSGTIDMRTTRPLEYDHRVISLNVRGQTNSLGELNPKEGQYGWRLGGTYIDQFSGGKLGLVVGVSLMDDLNPYQEYASWGYPNGGWCRSAAPCPPATPVVPSNVVVPGGAKFNSVVDGLKRNAALATLQYRPNEHFESTLDFFGSTFRDDWRVTRVEAPMYNWGSQDLLPGYTVNNGYVTGGTFTPGVHQIGREESDRKDNDLWAIGWKNTYTNGPWSAMLDAGYSSVQRHSRLLENYAGTSYGGGGGAVDPMPFTLDSNMVMHVAPKLDYGNYSNMLLADSGCWGNVNGLNCAQQGYLKYDKVHDHMATLKLELQRDLGAGFFKGVTAGLYFTNRTKTKSTDEYFLVVKSVWADANTYYAAHGNSYAGYTLPVGTPIPDQYRTGVSSGLSYFGIPGFASWNADAAFDGGFYSAIHNTGPWAYQKGYDVNEAVYTGYIKTDIDTLLANHALTGNIGLQFVYTHQTSAGFGVSFPSNAPPIVIPLTGGLNYGQLLPSMNLSFEINDSSKIRLGGARELVRARMDQMVNVNSYSFGTSGFDPVTLADSCPAANWMNCSHWSGDVGNPKLKPWIADAVDLSYEYYHGKDTYLAIAGFYKNLESYIYKQTTPFDFTGYLTPTGYKPNSYMGYVSQDVNGSGGNIAGIEVSGAFSGSALSGWLEGFGLTGNISYTDSSMKGVSNSGTATPLPGLSKLVYNGTMYYDNEGFSARVNYNFRSRYYAQIKGFDNTYTNNEFKAQAWLGAQIGYTFQEGTAKGLNISLQADNLLHAKQMMYHFDADPNDTRNNQDWWRFGTTYQVSLSYRFE
ncbi:iron complex outermembrane receptor protein [Rhizomicrobium palustre]|uniref:Iron complex outermembrane receptor protein n=1 Tax=Rhizomicrobium palustre TaxID=189966 RepID=A0A846MXQ5_9PROT|nr:TonB-dependent receptor [Rhizomicrobium palustre]NIK88374.1 iron complex outermembrane receptor protein [Rhizomicrobium palustre]